MKRFNYLGILRIVLNALVNTFLIATCLLLAWTYYSEWRSARAIQAAAAVPALPSDYKPGDVLGDVGLEFSAVSKTLIVAVQSRCQFCAASMPFYARLMASRPSTVRVVVVTPGGAKEGALYVKEHGFAPDLVIPFQPALTIKATPTLILADQRGVVEASWTGLLSKDREAEVLRAIR